MIETLMSVCLCIVMIGAAIMVTAIAIEILKDIWSK